MCECVHTSTHMCARACTHTHTLAPLRWWGGSSALCRRAGSFVWCRVFQNSWSTQHNNVVIAWDGTQAHTHTHTHTWSTVPTTSEVKSSRRVRSPPGGITQRNLANFGVSSDAAITSSLQMQGRRKGSTLTSPHHAHHSPSPYHNHLSPFDLTLLPSTLTHTTLSQLT